MASTVPEVFPTSRHGFITPANSSDIASGDAVMVDTSGRLAVCTKTALGAANFVGFAADAWSQQIALDKYGATAPYATPGSFSGGTVHKMHVLMEDTVVSIPIKETSGKQGQLVFLDTATTGAQIGTIYQPATASTVVTLGRLERDFTGATANDRQNVVCKPAYRNSIESDIEFWLKNHVDDGLLVGFDDTSKVSYNAGGVFVGGKYFRVAAAQNLDMAQCASHATKARIALVYVGLGGTVRSKDTGGVKFTFTAAGATTGIVARNSHYWPTFSQEGVIIAACVFRSGSESLRASRGVNVRRAIGDVACRKYITANPWTSGAPTLR